MKFNRLLLSSLVAIGLSACGTAEVDKAKVVTPSAADEQKVHPVWPKLDIAVKADPAVEAKVSELLQGMTLEQKVAQMIQPEIRDVTVEEMRQYGFGSYLNGGGSYPNGNKQSTASDWVDLAEQMYQASIDDSLDGSTIPTMWGTDAVHGHNNVIGATLFPHNIGLGAANDPALIERIAEVTATEVLVTGIDWIFAPTVATVRNDRWGRTYEGYSEHPDIVRDYSAAIVKGLQGQDESFMGDGKVISNVKHFVGDGGTTDGIDQGNTVVDDEILFNIHSQGYVGGLSAGSQVVMASFNRWNGKKIHGSKYLLTDVLKDTMGFDGFVVGDWNGHGQVAGCSNESCPQSINAGLDMFMAPTQSWKPLFKNTVQQIKDGIIPMSRVDDAVTRILRVKVRAGLFEKPSPAKRSLSGKTELLGSAEHRAVAREAVRKSLVLLKNQDKLLPLSPTQNILVAGDGADNIGKQSGGWTITWQGTNNVNSDFPGGSSIWDGISTQVSAAGGTATLSVDGTFTDKPDVAVVVFGEEPYAEGVGDIATLEYSPGNKKDLALLQSFKDQGIPVVALFITGRPLWVNPELNASDAFAAVWLPGSEGAGVADVILRDANNAVQYDFHGKLSFSWPQDPNQIVNKGDENYDPLFPYGFGLTYQDTDLLGDDLSEVITSERQDKPLVFFERSTQAPWALTLVSAFNTVEVNANSMAIGDVQYRTEDRVVQEDAFQIKTLGGSWAGVRFKGNGQAQDFNASMTENNQLSMLVNVKESPTADVLVGLNCGTVDGCKSVVNIREQLTTLPTNTWISLSIDAKCWSDKGISYAALNEGLSIISAGKMTVSFSALGFVKPDAASTIKCP
jgi:beta-glucosidase